jgi:hypothetical protein
MTEEIDEVTIGPLFFTPSEYQLDTDRYLTKIVIISKLFLSVARKGPLAIRDISWI